MIFILLFSSVMYLVVRETVNENVALAVMVVIALALFVGYGTR